MIWLKPKTSWVTVYPDGKAWRNKEGELHRENGPALEHFSTKSWYLNGELHRENGPAIEYSGGTKKWYFNGNLHREDGPAIEYPGGDKKWWLNGYPFSEEEWKEKLGR